MLSSKILTVFALATLAAADDYTTDDYDQGSTYTDEGSSYTDEGSSYTDEGTSYGSGSFDYSALPAYTYTFDPEYSAGVSGTIN
ncbi:hypothetical protein L915_16314, partial [Phytophthora nicotianae]